MALDLGAAGAGELLKPEPKKTGFTAQIYWNEDQQVRHLVYLNNPEEILKVRLHTFVKVPDNSERGWHPEVFLCLKDRIIVADSGGVCPLCDKNHKARDLYFGLAYELEPKLNGKKVAGFSVLEEKFTTKDGEEKTVPRWGYVAQTRSNFYNIFTAQALRQREQKDMEVGDYVFEIQRIGKDQKTSYLFNPIDHLDFPKAADVFPEGEIPTLEVVLDGLSNEDKYARVADVEVVPDEEDKDDQPAPSAAQDAFDRIKAEVESAQKEPAVV